MRSLKCLFGDHTDVVKVEEHTIYTECLECGRRTSGWRDIGIDTTPRRTIDTLQHPHTRAAARAD